MRQEDSIRATIDFKKSLFTRFISKLTIDGRDGRAGERRGQWV